MLKNILYKKKNIKKFTFEQNIKKYENIFILYKIKTKPLIDLYNNSNLKAKNTNKRLNVCWYLVIFLFYIQTC